MFRIQVEKTKGSGQFITYFVGDKVCEIINDIVLSQGFVEASAQSWNDIQTYHGHRVSMTVSGKNDSADSGLEQSLQALPVCAEDRIKKLEGEINLALKELSSLKKKSEPSNVQSNESFNFTSFKGLWEKTPAADSDKRGETSGNLASTTEDADVWAPRNEDKLAMTAKSDNVRKPQSVSIVSSAGVRERSRPDATDTSGKPLKRIQPNQVQTSTSASPRRQDITPIG